MGACDYLIHSPSTFSGLSCFLNGNQKITLEKNKIAHIDDFKEHNGFLYDGMQALYSNLIMLKNTK
jgi:hypothetical protein